MKNDCNDHTRDLNDQIDCYYSNDVDHLPESITHASTDQVQEEEERRAAEEARIRKAELASHDSAELAARLEAELASTSSELAKAGSLAERRGAELTSVERALRVSPTSSLGNAGDSQLHLSQRTRV
jgi:hypothetical protein